MRHRAPRHAIRLPILGEIRPGDPRYPEYARQRRGLTPSSRRYPLGGRPYTTPWRMIGAWRFGQGGRAG